VKDKIKKTVGIYFFSIVFAVTATIILYEFFPQFLYKMTYDVHESNLYAKEVREVAPGEAFTETFSPQLSFLTAVGIHIVRERSDDKVVGRLYDEAGKLIAEESFMLKDVDYRFSFMRRLDTDKTYSFEIFFPENNENSMEVTFGPEGIGPSEHISFSENGEASENIIYMQYVYGTYSKKLLALWGLMFWVAGLIIAESMKMIYLNYHGLYVRIFTIVSCR
jgi:hypothetical protein